MLVEDVPRPNNEEKNLDSLLTESLSLLLWWIVILIVAAAVVVVVVVNVVVL